MNRYLINVSTNWCGMDYTYPAVANNEEELWDIAQQLAYDNFESYNLWEEIAKEEGYEPEEMSEAEWDNLYETVDETNYYGFSIEEFDGDDEEWESYGKEVYGA